MRTQEIEKAAAKARVNLANAEAEFKEKLARNRSQWADEEEAHFKRVKEMTEEINALEARRKNALVPVEHIKRQVEAELKEAQGMSAELKARIEKNDQLTELLEDKLDAAGQQLMDNQQKGKLLEAKELSLKQQSDNTVAAVKDLNKKMTEFVRYQEVENKKLDARKTELVLIERSLIAKDERQKITAQELEKIRLKLLDDRVSLEEAWKELKAKQR